MKRFSLHTALVIATLILFAATKVSAQNQMKKEPVLWTAEDIKWEQISGGAPESTAMHAKLWGDNTKGAYGGFNKFPPNFKAPLHSHTNDAKIVVIKGAYIYNGKPYGPGSYVFIPGGEKHESGGAEDSETIFFIEQPGKFDLKAADAAK